MPKPANHNRAIVLAVTTALASTMLAGCTTGSAEPANLSAVKTQTALADGKTDKAVSLAEATVLAEPRNAAYRAMLGAVYMEAGRFPSAARSFADAMELGDNSGRTALSFALAQIAAGQQNAALSALNDHRSAIDPSDLGLALSLAGRPEQGVHVLGNALRSGGTSAKLRQNLAYSYALMGDWRAARLMAAEDVPGDQLGARMAEWAQTAAPEAFHARVANLLGVPVIGDSGQPAALALANHASVQQLAAAAIAEETAPIVTRVAEDELPPISVPMITQASMTNPDASTKPVPVMMPASSFDSAFVAKSAAALEASAPNSSTNRSAFVAKPPVQAVAKPSPASPGGKVAAVSMNKAPNGNHLIQLGSFSSQKSAERAWGIYQDRYPQLSRYDRVITKAEVRGKTYYRVSAGGFERAGAVEMCKSVKAERNGCISWAANAPLPGTVGRGARVAAR